MDIWHVVVAANLVTAAAYLTISYLVASGLGPHQLGRNMLGLATALIFLSCAVHHGSHSVHMLLPSLGIEDAQAMALRESWHWPTAGWDIFAAVVALFYLSLRRQYDSVLRGAQMFEDLKVRRRQALEINDTIVQGLVVAQLAYRRGEAERGDQALQETLENSRGLMNELLAEDSVEKIQPGDLRRSEAAVVLSRAGD